MSCDLINLATPGVAGLHPYQPGKSVAELERELGIKDIIKLASNENPLGSGEKAKQALLSTSELSRYPDGNGHDLKMSLSKLHGVNPDQITLGNGSNEILELITRAISGPQHEIIFSEHAFAVYPLVTQAVGAKAVVVPAHDWGHDTVAMRAAINKNSRVMFIANPNNPTGTWLDKQTLRVLLESIPDYMVVVLDEAYFEYVEEDDYPNCVQWVNEFPQLLVTRTFSKAYGLAGLRIGYGISHRDIADLMNRVRQPFNVNSLALSAAEAALTDREHLQQSIRLNQIGMEKLTSAFDAMNLQYIPSVGNFICVDIKQSGLSGMEIYKRLLHKGVIVRPIDNYGMPNYLRVTIGLEKENEKFINALDSVLTEIKAESCS
ncbi:MAG: histidinol-phosphate aminotransferase [Gammaproteobacteria bacterium]|jgi:histidinol-phosphate aminotransferase